MLNDIRYAIRTLSKAPGFTLGAVFTLALGIGANTAIFSVIEGVLLRPLQYREPQQLVRIYETERAAPGGNFPVSGPDFRDWQARSRLFADMAAYSGDNGGANLTAGDRPERVSVSAATHNVFSILGVRPLLGRDFVPEDERLQGPHAPVILSYGFWQLRFSGNPGIVGRTIMLDGSACDVIGIMPKGFHPLIQQADLWLPKAPAAGEQERDSHYLNVVGRLKPGVTIQQAQQEMNAVSGQMIREHPGTSTTRVRLVNLDDDILGRFRGTALPVAGAVAFVLLIACVNVANLLLARGVGRAQETAIRASLGAGRWRLVRQMLTESLILSLAGGALGVLIAVWGVDLLRHTATLRIPRADEIGIDRTLLQFSALLSIATGVLSGIAPALRLSGREAGVAFRASATRTVAGGHAALRGALVTIEVGLAIVLLAGAGLLLRSLHQLMAVDPGFHPEGVLTAQMALPDTRYHNDAQVLAFARNLRERLRAVPGVRSASVTSKLPLEGGRNWTILAEGQPPNDNSPLVEISAVLPGYFQAIGIPLKAGRDFTDRDLVPNGPTVIVNEALVRRFFPKQNPIGRHVRLPSDPPQWLEIAGVVGDARQWSMGYPAIPELYLAGANSRMIAVVRTMGDPLALVPAARQALAAVDKDLPLYDIKTMQQSVANSSAGTRSVTGLFGIVAALALTLAAIGIYGVVAFSMSQRKHEIGIRIALGATSRNVIAMALRDSAKPVGAGIVLGIGAAMGLTKYLAGNLYGVKPLDPATFIAAPVFLAAVAALASYVPAHRASGLDPAAALRNE